MISALKANKVKFCPLMLTLSTEPQLKLDKKAFCGILVKTTACQPVVSSIHSCMHFLCPVVKAIVFCYCCPSILSSLLTKVCWVIYNKLLDNNSKASDNCDCNRGPNRCKMTWKFQLIFYKRLSINLWNFHLFSNFNWWIEIGDRPFSNFQLQYRWLKTTTDSICAVLASIWSWVFLNANTVLHYLQVCVLLEAWLLNLFH